jgi:hypothetical protein
MTKHEMDKPMSAEFERGVRFVVESDECYSKGTGDAVTQFGDYQMSMEHRPASSYLKNSAEHREKRIQAMLALASKQSERAP